MHRRGRPPQRKDDDSAISLAGARGGVGKVVFSFDDVVNSVDASVASGEAERLDLEHVVCVFDVLSGLPSVFGPFADPIAASRFASRFVSDVGCNYEWALRVRVVPLDRIPATTPSGRRSMKEQFRSARHLRGVRRVMRRSNRGM